MREEDSAVAKSYLITLSEIEENANKKNQGIKSNYSLGSGAAKKESALLNKKRYNK